MLDGALKTAGSTSLSWLHDPHLFAHGAARTFSSRKGLGTSKSMSFWLRSWMEHCRQQRPLVCPDYMILTFLPMAARTFLSRKRLGISSMTFWLWCWMEHCRLQGPLVYLVYDPHLFAHGCTNLFI